MVPIANYLVLSAMLFIIGVMGVLCRRSALIIFMSISGAQRVNLSFVAFARL
jgi:NADH-quinone oxidoreductase subunit K